MTLRPYQDDSIAQLHKGFTKHKRQVLCLPTGAGKTIIFSSIAQKAVQYGTPTMIVTDRIELFSQTWGKLKANQLKPELIRAEDKTIKSGILHLCMIETVSRRDISSINPKLIIIDEAHKANFTKLIEKFPDAWVIGATATPIGKHFHKLYDNIVQNVSIQDLIHSGHLAPVKAYQMQDDLSDLKTNRGEFTEASQWDHFNSNKLYDGVIERYKSHANQKKTLIFNCNIAHAEAMTERFNLSGIPSKCITSRTSQSDRANILAQFSGGEFPVLNNCGILTTGYDEPSIECIVMNRATMSLPLWLQCCGRGSRTHRNKENFIILDFGMNHDRHGRWNENRLFNLDPPKKRQLGTAPVKSCPECDAMLHASAMKCEYCGYTFKMKQKRLKTGELVEIDELTDLKGKKISELTCLDLLRVEKSKRFKSAFIWRVVRSREMLSEYASIKGYSRGWIFNQNKLGVGFKDVEV